MGPEEHTHLWGAWLQREPERGQAAEREEVAGTCAKPEGGGSLGKEGVDSRVKCSQKACREEGTGGQLFEGCRCPRPEPCWGHQLAKLASRGLKSKEQVQPGALNMDRSS